MSASIGKLLGRVAIATVQVAVFVFIALVVFRIDWGHSPVALMVLVSSTILCAAALSLLVGAVFARPESASGFGVILVLAMSALGGCWWPAEIMPEWMRLAGHAFPTAWAMDGLHQLLSCGGGLREVLLPCSVLLVYGLVVFSLATRLLKVNA